MYRRKKDTGQPHETLLSVYRDYGVIEKSSRDDNKNRESEDLSGYQLVVDGDLVTNKMKAWQGSIAVSTIRGIVSPAYYVYRKLHSGNDAYFHHLFRSVPYITGYQSISKGIRVGQWDLEADKFRLFPVLIPPRREQDAIVSHLDRATTRIDALIAKKLRFIELLREKRQALITHAVTKGLDACVSMKDSGIDWLGEVPVAWRLPQIKFVAYLGNGSTPTRDNAAYWKGGSFPWLTSTCVNQVAVIAAEEFVTKRALSECHLPIIEPPAVLVGITGQGKTRGMATTLLIRATINQHMVYLKPRLDLVSTEYLRYFVDSAYRILRFDSEGAGSTKGAITQEQLANLRVPLPRVEVQKEIVVHLDRATTRIDTLITKTERSIELLREHRTALITAAVTGKVDLRNAA